MASPKKRALKKPKPKQWTECAVCNSLMKDPSNGECFSCLRQTHQESAIAEADGWIDLLPLGLHHAIRDRLVDAIENAFSDAEQGVIDHARATGLMPKPPRGS